MNEEGKLAGKVALVTGGSRGIGQSLAIGLAEAGASVAVVYKNGAEAADATCQTIHQAGGEAEALQADIGSKRDFERIVDVAGSHFGKLDILINNAARTRFGPIDEVTEDDFDDVVNTVLRGPFFGSLAAAKWMVKHGSGSIINISSISVRGIMYFHSSYTLAKGGLEAMTRQMALELSPRIRVNAIAPTATSNVRNAGYDTDYDQKWAAVTPLGRVAVPNDYVQPAVFLASDDAAMITGQILYVDGGWTLQGKAPDQSDFDFSADRKQDG